MKLSDRYSYIVLCEDAQMKTFIRSFLKEQGIPAGKIRIKNNPPGIGCGEQFVKREYVNELKLLKSRNYNKEVLVVCIDADSLTVRERKQNLFDAESEDISKWKRDERPVLILVPKRCIETWLHFLRGEDVDENKKFPHSGAPVNCKDEALEMYKFFAGQNTYDLILDSLKCAKEEYEHICQLQGQRL